MVITSDLGAILDNKPQFLRNLNDIMGISEENIFITHNREFPGRVAVMLPTYNEFHNLAIIVPTILIIFDHYRIDGHIVVVDDDSPDKSWELVQDFARVDPRVKLIHRTNVRGRGTAGITGLRACLCLGADYATCCRGRPSGPDTKQKCFVPACLFPSGMSSPYSARISPSD